MQPFKRPVKLKQTSLTALYLLVAALLQVGCQVAGKIIDEGLWSTVDTFTGSIPGYGGLLNVYSVTNGVPDFSQVTRVSSAHMTWYDDIQDIYASENIARITSVFPATAFNRIFSESATHGATYEDFLFAASQFPHFCGYHQELADWPNLSTAENACKREIATLLAHVVYETGNMTESEPWFTGLTSLVEEGCEVPGTRGCEYQDQSTPLGLKFPPYLDQFYFGRGGLHLRWNGKYGQFSRSYFDETFYAEEILLAFPDDVNLTPDMYFASALWFYMTPHFPKPSAHAVVSGLFTPNQFDKNLNAGNDFGTTIGIMAQDSPEGLTYECMTDSQIDSAAALQRASLYDFYLEFFGLEPETGTGCATTLLTYGSAGEVPSFWYTDSTVNKCKLVNYETQFSIFNIEDYKRCICFWWGDLDFPENDCPYTATQYCLWEESPPINYDVFVAITSDTQQVQLVLSELLADLTFPRCVNSADDIEGSQGGDFRTEDFYAFQVTMDNVGEDSRAPNFRDRHANLADQVLGTMAPSQRYVAAVLGQTSLVYSSELDTEINFTFDTSLAGQWQFEVSACVDRRSESLGRLDCDLGANIVSLTIQQVCGTELEPDYPECQSTTTETAQTDVTITETDAPIEVNQDTLDSENQLPYFIDFDPFITYEVTKSETRMVELPSYSDDDEGDSVLAFARLSAEHLKWVDYDPSRNTLTLRPESSTKAGLSRIQIDLSDGKDTNEYYFSLWVNEAESQGPFVIGNDTDGSPTPFAPDILVPEDDGLGPAGGGSNQTDLGGEAGNSTSGNGPQTPPSGDTPSQGGGGGGDTGPQPNDPPSDGGGSQTPDPPIQAPYSPPPAKEPQQIVNESRKPTEFDPQTLWAVDTLQQRVTEKQEQVKPKIEKDQVKKIPEPVSVIHTINSNGELKILFNQEMLLYEVFGDFKFTTKAEYVDLDEDLDDFRRLLQAETEAYSEVATEAAVTQTFTPPVAGSTVDLSSIIFTDVQRGDNSTSAPSSQLDYSLRLVGFDDESIELKFEFKSPLSVSKGAEPDLVNIEFVQPDLFVSAVSGKTLQTTLIRKTLPQQFISEESYQLAVVAGNTVQAAANTALLSQFGVTICLAVSLKAMWNLMHVMQVMSYLRLAVNWPANANMMLDSMHEAITLDKFVNAGYEYILVDLSFSDETGEEGFDEEREQLQENSIQYKNLGLSLGIFGICLGVLVGALLLYILLQTCASKIKCCGKVIGILKAKLFYNVWIRYLIESNLKTTHDCVFFLYVSGSFADTGETLSTSLRIALLSIIVIWPFFLTVFLHCQRGHLQEETFKRKFISMYNGTKTQHFSALMYTSVFCARRFLLVLGLLACRDRQLLLVYAYSLLQTFYFYYMTNVVPHEESIHNRLEYFNELCLIAMQHSMVFFVVESPIDEIVQWTVGTIVMCIFAFVFFVNVFALIYLTVVKLRHFWRVRKARQAYIKARKNKTVLKDSARVLLETIQEEPLAELDIARNQSSIRAIESEDSVSQRIRDSLAQSQPLDSLPDHLKDQLDQQMLYNIQRTQRQDSIGAQLSTLLRPRPDIAHRIKMEEEKVVDKLAESYLQHEVGVADDDESRLEDRFMKLPMNPQEKSHRRNGEHDRTQLHSRVSGAGITTALGSINNLRYGACSPEGFVPKGDEICGPGDDYQFKSHDSLKDAILFASQDQPSTKRQLKVYKTEPELNEENGLDSAPKQLETRGEYVNIPLKTNRSDDIPFDVDQSGRELSQVSRVGNQAQELDAVQVPAYDQIGNARTVEKISSFGTSKTDQKGGTSRRSETVTRKAPRLVEELRRLQTNKVVPLNPSVLLEDSIEARPVHHAHSLSSRVSPAPTMTRVKPLNVSPVHSRPNYHAYYQPPVDMKGNKSNRSGRTEDLHKKRSLRRSNLSRLTDNSDELSYYIQQTPLSRYENKKQVPLFSAATLNENHKRHTTTVGDLPGGAVTSEHRRREQFANNGSQSLMMSLVEAGRIMLSNKLKPGRGRVGTKIPGNNDGLFFAPGVEMAPNSATSPRAGTMPRAIRQVKIREGFVTTERPIEVSERLERAPQRIGVHQVDNHADEPIFLQDAFAGGMANNNPQMQDEQAPRKRSHIDSERGGTFVDKVAAVEASAGVPRMGRAPKNESPQGN